MEPHAAKNFKEIEPDNRSLVVAFSNLLQNFDIDLEPIQLNAILTQDNPNVTLRSLVEHIDDMEIVQYSDAASSWPNTDDAIVKFRRMDIESAGPIAHYCSVADYKNRTIIDSLDGLEKPASTYGNPLGWVSYDSTLELEALAQAEPMDPRRLYTVKEGGESAWGIARLLNIPGLTATAIIEHNDIETPTAIPGGTQLHLPIAIPPKLEEKLIRYEVLETPVDMHVTKEGGARKFSFGNVKKWKHISPTGPTYPINTNVKIVGIAHVPIEEDDTEAAYYMDAVSLGAYASTGRVAYTTGFNHTHLADGHVERVKEAPAPAVKKALKKIDEAMIAKDLAEIEPEPVAVDWKLTKRIVQEGVLPATYIAQEDIVVREMDGRRPARTLEKGKGVKIGMIFDKDGVTYGLPTSHDETGYWFGIPMNFLEKQPYKTTYTVRANALPVAKGLTIEERIVVVVSKVLSQYTRLTSFLTRNKK